MMTEGEWRYFRGEMQALAERAVAHGQDLEAALAPHYYRQFRRHPDEEADLQESYDRLTARPML